LKLAIQTINDDHLKTADDYSHSKLKKYKKKVEERNGKVKYNVPLEDYDMPKY
jgi:hypothetical protein